MTKGSTGVKVEGSTRLAPLHGAWFRARLFPAGAPQTFDNGRPRVASAPQLLLGIRDSSGELIEVHASLQVEVDSKDLGRALWQVTADPEPLRKRRRVIGYLAQIERVIEQKGG